MIGSLSYFSITIISLSLISEFIPFCICSRIDLSNSDYIRQRSKNDEKRESLGTLSYTTKDAFTVIRYSDKTSTKQSQAFYFDFSFVLIG
jgi:hypothetical protein